MDHGSPQERFQALLRSDRRFRPEAYNFVFEALDHTVQTKYSDEDGKTEAQDSDESTALVSRHVTGPDLLEGVRQLAIDHFGCLAHTVMERWGITESIDFGEIVFNLVEYGLMGSQESDSKEDFRDGYGGAPLRDVFTVHPELEYYPERDEWTATYKGAVFG